MTFLLLSKFNIWIPFWGARHISDFDNDGSVDVAYGQSTVNIVHDFRKILMTEQKLLNGWKYVTPTSNSIKSIENHNSNLLLTVNSNNYNSQLLISEDEGKSWIKVKLPLSTSWFYYINFAESINDKIFLGTHDGLFISKDDGTTWIKSNLTNNNVYSIKQKSGLSVVGINGQGIYISKDDGMNWTKSYGITCLYADIDGQKIIASQPGFLILSKDAGTSWKNLIINRRLPDYSPVIFKDSFIFYVDNDGVKRSSDDGISWETKNNGLNNLTIYNFFTYEKYLFAVTDQGGVFVTSSNGDKWKAISLGLDIPVKSIEVAKSKIFVGTDVGLFSMNLTDFLTIVDVKESQLPTNFTLHQNYPNPFNPSTTINYTIATTEHVMLKVFDVLGREVATLVNKINNPGSYAVTFNTANYSMPSGVYFYKLNCGSYSASKKMILIK